MFLDFFGWLNGGGGGSRTRVRNRCQPGESMLCPIQLVSPPALKNGQDALKTSPIDLASAARTEPLQPACCATPARGPQAKPRRTAAYLIKQQVPDYRWQLWFCRRLRVPTPRHASHAASDPVETVTPPLCWTSLESRSPGCEPGQWAVLHL